MFVASTAGPASAYPDYPQIKQGIQSDEDREAEQLAEKESLRRKSAADRLQELLDAHPAKEERTVINRLLREGNAGNAESKELGIEYFKQAYDAAKYYGSLGAMSREWIIEEVVGNDLLSREYALNNAEALELQLRSRGDTPLIKMAVDRVLNAYVAAGVNDYMSTMVHSADDLPPEHVAALESGERRFLTALQSLELAERLEDQKKPSKPRAKAAS